MHGGTTYATPDIKRAATQGRDEEYPYAATTAVVGSELELKQETGKEPGSKKKVTEDESARPAKPQRGKKKQPTLSNVHHKQGPAGDVYAIPNKEAPEVGHKVGSQGDMYAMAAKPSMIIHI